MQQLRGSIVPIIDVRIRFTLGTPASDQFTVVIVLNSGWRVLGMVEIEWLMTGEDVGPLRRLCTEKRLAASSFNHRPYNPETESRS